MYYCVPVTNETPVTAHVLLRSDVRRNNNLSTFAGYVDRREYGWKKG